MFGLDKLLILLMAVHTQNKRLIFDESKVLVFEETLKY